MRKTEELLSASFMDYAVPRRQRAFFSFRDRNVPSTTNALGIKGAGRAGTIGTTPATLNTIDRQLYRAYGVRHIDMPATRRASGGDTGRRRTVTSNKSSSSRTLVGIASKILSVSWPCRR